VPIITLTTDFGLDDWFVGSMKGVILGIAPEAQIVDITHGVAPGDLWGGAFALASAVHCFPEKTIHVAVVDPGVGGDRGALVVETPSAFFVGPDNGVLSLVLRNTEVKSIRRLENPLYTRGEISRTFHGRDIFAPAAAHLANGTPVVDFGPPQDSLEMLLWPEPRLEAGAWIGEVIHVDHFGNAITSLAGDGTALGPDATVGFGVLRVPVRDSYQAITSGQGVAVIGSTGLIEIAVNGGNAARQFGLKRGDRVELTGLA
jgi:S-adenosylmethionine hydrolase